MFSYKANAMCMAGMTMPVGAGHAASHCWNHRYRGEIPKMAAVFSRHGEQFGGIRFYSESACVNCIFLRYERVFNRARKAATSATHIKVIAGVICIAHSPHLSSAKSRIPPNCSSCREKNLRGRYWNFGISVSMSVVGTEFGNPDSSLIMPDFDLTGELSLKIELHMLRPITEKVHSGNGPVSFVLGATIRSFDIAPPRFCTQVTEACNEKRLKKTETAKQSTIYQTRRSSQSDLGCEVSIVPQSKFYVHCEV